MTPEQGRKEYARILNDELNLGNKDVKWLLAAAMRLEGDPLAQLIVDLLEGTHSSGIKLELAGGRRGKRRRDDYEDMQIAILDLVVDLGQPLESALAAIEAKFNYRRSQIHTAYKAGLQDRLSLNEKLGPKSESDIFGD
ncbi:MAG: hypothetical protein KUA43_08795 [Hoeflea sp.]|uniref:hypothetical protein n=1 Tax=Hoeflea sp. TaxID=1940281 RepID=UPI001D477A0E|nr:hypothetical protein [Hoeflea sp.]MBU4529762.1 hypothetical protein [Alphaproteobacteria bacterium]MBU4543323.1 hypothetical protein [Alphaproteobacteria bacterium]MBU4552510.1 hypothetical protein [Alphaproteobacteria bacterium]MBV1723526.1 hypothetical protein [Hoeflea sp.]MBV1762975.1 hypothetical protein [Hoeflea sp.]